ncbi:MAG: 2-oxoacid:acceptor oxidoreductase family protein [Bacteroidales bacterium]|jgi:2-oxoglutarate ferredoxin oxidoreductase subunit gamma|nr:2-oxoacid:acceptor oxidoreductase family protein [Bacteroidales bacterium]
MLDEIIFAGFGGQGVLLMGRLIAQAGMIEGKQVAWMPSYGPEMRGGTANCTVIVSSEEVASPVVPNPMTLIAMNQPSLDKFEPMVVKNGIIIINQSLVSRDITRDDVEVVRVPANDIANELGNLRVANMVALGSYIAKSKSVMMENVFKALDQMLDKRQEKLIALNKEALKRGENIVTG